MGPTWGRQDPGGPHVGHTNLAIWEYIRNNHASRFRLQNIMLEHNINVPLDSNTKFTNPYYTIPCEMYVLLHMVVCYCRNPDGKVHGAIMGPTWVLSAPDGPHVGPMNLAIREAIADYTSILPHYLTDTEYCMLTRQPWSPLVNESQKSTTNWLYNHSKTCNNYSGCIHCGIYGISCCCNLQS